MSGHSPVLLRWTIGLLVLFIVAFCAVFLTPWEGETRRGKWTYFLNITSLIAHVPEIRATEPAHFWYGYEDNGAPAHEGISYCSMAHEKPLKDAVSDYLKKAGWQEGDAGHWQRQAGIDHPRIDLEVRTDDYTCHGLREVTVEQIWPTHFDEEAARVRKK